MTRPVLVTAALAPYLAVGAPAAMLLFVITHNWVGVVLAVAVTIAGIAVRWNWYVGGRTDAGVGIRVVSANLRYGRANCAAVVRLAEQHADILAVQELTPERAARSLSDPFSTASRPIMGNTASRWPPLSRR